MHSSLIGATAFFGLAFIGGVVAGYFAGYFTPRNLDRPEARAHRLQPSLMPIHIQALLLVVASMLAGGMLLLGIVGLNR